MADLHLFHSPDPEALLLHAAAPFLATGRAAEALPLLVLRQGTLRDQVIDRAARAGCTGWFGEPLVVFGELPARLGVEHAPLTTRERTVLLRQLMRERRLAHLERSCAHPRLLAALDALIGDLRAERVAPAQLEAALGAVAHDDWDERRNAEALELYRAYLDALAALPEQRGRPRSDGRDGLALAAELLHAEPQLVRERLRRPFATGEEPCVIRIVGLMDLRRGWRRLLDALCESNVVDELAVYLPERDGPAEREALSDHALWDHLAPHAEAVHALPALVREAGLATLHDTLFRTAAGTVGDAAVPVHALAAPDEEREADEIARRVKRLIVEQGTAPERIAVVMRESRPYAPLVAEALRRAGVPVSARLRHAPTESGAVLALLGVLRAAGHGWTARELIRVAGSPYFDVALDVGLLRRAGATAPLATLVEWERALASFAVPRADDEGSGRGGEPTRERAAGALDAFRVFRAAVEPLSAERRASEWIDATCALLGAESSASPDGLWRLRHLAERAPGPLDDALAVDAVRLDCRAIGAVERVLAEWAAALALDGEADRVMTAAEWHDELQAALDAEEVVLHAPHERGVQVLEAFAAVGRPWEHLFIVGMSSGAFPAEPGARPLYSDAERAALHATGLPLDTQEVWYAREAALFRALLATARRSATLSYAYASADGGVRLASAYFEEVRERLGHDDADAWLEVIPGSRIAPEALDAVWSRRELALHAARAWREPETQATARAALGHLHRDPAWSGRIEQALHAARIDELRASSNAAATERDSAAHAWNGRVDDAELVAHLEARFGDAVWSTSQLEAYGNCPWSFFGRYVLRLESVAEPGDDVDGATRGALLHRCLERVYRELAERFGDDALHPDHFDHAEARLRELIPEVMHDAAAHGWTGAEPLRAAREQDLFETVRRYIRWEMEQNAASEHHTRPLRRAMREHEVVFGMDGHPPAELESGGRTLRLRGKIDRIDAIADERAEGWLYVVDHKSGASAFASAERRYQEGVILQLPLYLRVAEQRRPDAPGTWGGSYQILREPARKAPLHLVSYTKSRGLSGEGSTQQKALGQVDAALEHALDHVDAIRGGVFPARIPTCATACPSYCEFLDICREHVGTEAGS